MIDLPDLCDAIVAVDVEASGLHPDPPENARLSIVSIAWSGGSLVLPFDQGYDTWLGPKTYPKKYPGPSLFDRDINLGLAEWGQLVEWLQRQHLVFHNAPYDLMMINAGLRNRPDTGVDLGPSYCWDTMVVAPLLWPNESVSLDHLGKIALGKEKAHTDALKAWRNRYLDSGDRGRFDLAPDDVIIPYAQQDPELTLELYYDQMRRMDEGEAAWEAVDREIDLALVLYYAQRTGVGYDVDRSRHIDRELAVDEAELHRFLSTKIGVEPTEDAMRYYWFERLGQPVWKKTDAGKPAVSADVVRDLVEHGVPCADEYQQYTKVQTARSMWYGPWAAMAGPDHRLRTVFRQTKTRGDQHDSSGPERGTISGRLAVSRVQLQAIPHDYQIPDGVTPVRKLFTARPGHTVVEIDVSQAEMRGVAGLSRCKPLLEQFAAGVDAHTATCKLVFGLEEDDYRWDFHRNVSKRLNFGIVYGAGIPTLIDQIKIYTGVDVAEDEARRWWDAAKRSMPEVFRFSYHCRKQVEATRQIGLVGGRVRFFTPYEFDHKAMNAVIQGSVAVAMADSMIEIHRLFGPGVVLLQIHDSVWLELPSGRVDAMVSTAQAVICETFTRHFGAPFETDSKIIA